MNPQHPVVSLITSPVVPAEMKTSRSKSRIPLWSVRLLGMSLLSCFCAQATAAVHPWEKVEITLTAATPYENPYTDVDAWVTLTGPSGSGFETGKRCYGFWDGGNFYRVRVVATVPGTWNWISGSNQTDAGLNDQTGSFSAIAWTDSEKSANPVRLGFIKVTPNKRALMYADGTPFFAASTFWAHAGMTWRFPWRDTDAPYDVTGPDGGFKDWVKNSVSKGHNMVQSITSFTSWSYEDGYAQDLNDKSGVRLRGAWEHNGEPRAMTMHDENGERAFLFPGKSNGYTDVCPDYFRINPVFFRNMDKKVDYLNAHGMQVYLEGPRRDMRDSLVYYGISNSDPQRNAFSLYLKYLQTRYHANAVLIGPMHFDVESPSNDMKRAADAHFTKYGKPPFGQPIMGNVWGDAWWLDVTTAYGTGGGVAGGNSKRPSFLQESQFVKANNPDEALSWRNQVYSSVFNGAMVGVTCMITGQARGIREPHADTWIGIMPELWKTVNWDVTYQQAYARAFMLRDATRNVKYWDLVPKGGDLVPNGGGLMRTDDKRLYKCYFLPRSDRNAGTIANVPPATTYAAHWFNPRTGVWSEAGSNGRLTSDGNGIITLPSMPDGNDWGLSLYSSLSSQVSSPVFAPGPGTYTSATNVTISTTTSDAQIRYTTNGSTPSSTNGTLIGGTSGTVTISASCTLKAIAFKSGMTDSGVTSGIYTIAGSVNTITLTPIADSYVWADSNPTVNYGTATTVYVKDGNTNDKRAFFKFDLATIPTPIIAARLRVYGSSEGTTTVNAHGCDNDSWSETGITWNNQPAYSSSSLSTVVTTATAQYYEWDVTSYIQSQLAGDKMATLVLDSTSLEVKNFNGNSKENATNRPELVAQTALTQKTIEITSGYTLIALPLVPAATLTAESLAQQINADGGHCTSVIEYRDGAFETHPAGTAVENFTLAVGKGYFVRCDRASQVYVTGYPFDRALSTVALSPGYNLIGLPLDPEPADRYTAERVGQEINADDGNATQVITYENGAFQTHPIGTAVNNFPVATGKGYFVRTGKTSTWTVRR